MRKTIQIDGDMHRKFNDEADRLGLSLKKYAEVSMAFFANRGINPEEYSPGQSFDLMQVVKKSTDRIISFIVHQEQTLLSDITEEVVRTRLYQDALIVLVLENTVEPDQRNQKLMEISQYVEQRFKEIKQ